TKDPEQSILKFASTNNLAPAQVEMLGQLFNTAKTLSHLEKSASRGASFPIIDVPKMVSSYLELPDTKEETLTGKQADMSLPACLRGWESIGMEGDEQEIKIAASEDFEDPSVFYVVRKAAAVRRDNNIAAVN